MGDKDPFSGVDYPSYATSAAAARPTASPLPSPAAAPLPSARRAPVADPVLRFRYAGDGGSLFVLLLKNIFLTLVTLGIYKAWAKTERRKYLWANLEVGDQRLVYTGTGAEIFRGYLKILAVYGTFLLIGYLAAGHGKQASLWAQVPLLLAVVVGSPFILYWGLGYLTSRTRLRGIRLGLGGTASDFARTWLLGGLAAVLTLGLAWPHFFNRGLGLLIGNARWGSQKFAYDGKDSEVFRIFVKGCLLMVVTLGIYYFWFKADLGRYIVEHTTFMGARGRLRIDGGQILGLALLNAFATSASLGLAFPWVLTYVVNTWCGALSLVGPIDFQQIEQRASEGSAFSDGVADALDMGLGF